MILMLFHNGFFYLPFAKKNKNNKLFKFGPLSSIARPHNLYGRDMGQLHGAGTWDNDMRQGLVAVTWVRDMGTDTRGQGHGDRYMGTGTWVRDKGTDTWGQGHGTGIRTGINGDQLVGNHNKYCILWYKRGFLLWTNFFVLVHTTF
jgi:hypothetical protein